MVRNVIFLAPFPIEDIMRFVRATARLENVRLLGICHTLSDEGRRLFADVARVEDPFSVDDVSHAVALLSKKHGPAHRILGTLEKMMVLLAEVRERAGVPGTGVRTATLFREKALMKDVLRAAGLPVAKHALVTNEGQAKAFANQVGLPLIVKPPAGVGAKATFRVRTVEALGKALALAKAESSGPVLLEELIQGSEHSFETITIGGQPVVSSFADYYPGCLEVLENPWIQWACVLPREVDKPGYAQAKELGHKAIRVLGLDDGMTHMEWFLRKDGSVAIGEIAQRPPGPQLCQMTGLVNDVDIYRAWARAVVDGELDRPWHRRSAAGTAFVRGVGKGRITAVRGVREVHQAVGPYLVEAKLPVVGKPKNESYEGDGYVVVRHERTEMVRQLITTIIETMKVHYEG